MEINYFGLEKERERERNKERVLRGEKVNSVRHTKKLVKFIQGNIATLETNIVLMKCVHFSRIYPVGK